MYLHTFCKPWCDATNSLNFQESAVFKRLKKLNSHSFFLNLRKSFERITFHLQRTILYIIKYFVFSSNTFFKMQNLRIKNGFNRQQKVTPEQFFFMSKPFIKILYSFFSWMGINCFKTTEPLWRNSLYFITKFPGLPGTYFIDLRRMKAESTFPLPSGFECGTSRLGGLEKRLVL